MTKIKVLLVATEPAVGMVPFVATIINTLSADGRFEVFALLGESEKLSYSGIIPINTNISIVKKSKSTFNKFIDKIYYREAIKKMSEIVKQHSPDVIHFLNGEYAFANYLSGCNFWPNICLTIHDLIQHERENLPLKEKIITYLIKSGCARFIRQSLYLTTSSRMQCEKLKAIYPQKEIIFSHFPSLVISTIKNGKEQVPELKKYDKYILFFGTVDKYKGVDLLIRAFESLDTVNDYKLVIAGKGVDYPTTSRNVVRLNRFIKDEEVANLFKNATFIVYPYISATMSGVLSLAYYFRKKVLLSNVPFFKENAMPSCTFFKANDSIDLKEKLASMLGSSDMLFTADYYNELYSDRVLANDYYQLYSLISKR